MNKTETYEKEIKPLLLKAFKIAKKNNINMISFFEMSENGSVEADRRLTISMHVNNNTSTEFYEVAQELKKQFLP